MDAPPIKLVVIDDGALEMLDAALGELADAIETIREVGTSEVLLDSMLSLTCKVRAMVLEDRDRWMTDDQ